MIPENQRLAELVAYGVLDTAAEPAFDDIVRVAADAAGCPTALVSLLDEDRQWFKARHGLDAGQTPRDQAFCEHALRADAPLIVPDATADPRFADNPLVTGAPEIRFYAGFPLRTATGAVLGTLCVLGYEPRPGGLTGSQERLLTVLASQVMTQLELRRTLAQQAEALGELDVALSSYRALADHASDVISRHAPDGTTLYVSPSIRNVLGYDPEREVGRSAPERVHADDAGDMFRALGEVLGGVPSTASVRSRHADGTWRHLEIRLSPVCDESGAVVQIHSVARDVTDRHDVQERLALSEERFRVLFEANPVGQVELSPAGVVQRVNAAFADLVGVTPDDLLGRTPEWAAVDFDAAAQHLALLNAAEQPGTVLHSERTLRRPDGTQVEILGTVVGVPGDDGRTAMMIGSMVDVTERNRAHRRLAELTVALQSARDEAVRRQALTETVLQTVSVGIVACDGEGHLTTFNRATRDFHGMPADPALDPAAWADRYALFAEDGKTPLTREQVPLFRALTEGVVQGALIVIAPQGRPARVLCCDGRAMRDPQGRLLGAVVAMSDVTQARATARTLAEQAGRDPLTGLANRSQLGPLVQAHLDGPSLTTAGMLFLDLDGFKAVNDRHGHDAGDAVLVEVARRLAATVRPGDAVVRLGGDEFLVVCEVTTHQAQEVLARLADRVEREVSRPIAFRGGQLVVGSSCGLAVGQPGQSIEDLVGAADRAMYQRKRTRPGDDAPTLAPAPAPRRQPGHR